MENKKILIEKLKEKKETTLLNIKEIESSSKPVALDDSFGRLSRQDALLHQQMALRMKENLLLTLEQIKQAEKRIENNEFGICLGCEEEIDEKRLNAKPEASLCRNCQQ